MSVRTALQHVHRAADARTIFLVSVCLMSLVSTVSIIGHVTFPYATDYGEPVFILDAIRFMRFQLSNLYPVLSSTKAIPAVYPPLYYGLMAGLLNIGVPGYVAGRVLSMAAAIGTSFLIYKIIKLAVGQKWIALATAAGYLTIPGVSYFAGETKADFVGLFFVFLGMYMLFGKSRPNPYALACVFILAIIAKHYYMIAPTVALAVLFRRDKHLAVQFFITFGGLMATLIGLFQFLSDGRFLSQVIFGVAAPIRLSADFQQTTQFVRSNVVMIAVTIWSSVSCWRTGKKGWVIYLVMSFVYAAATIGKEGASTDYWLESTTVALIVTGIALSQLADNGLNTVKRLVSGLLVVQLASWMPAQLPFIHRLLEPQLYAGQTRLEAFVNQTSLSILLDNPGILTDAGKKLSIAPFEYKLLVENHVLSDGGLVNALGHGRYGVLILSGQERSVQDRFTPAVFRTMGRQFNLLGQLDDTWIYAYRGLARSTLAALKASIVASIARGA